MLYAKLSIVLMLVPNFSSPDLGPSFLLLSYADALPAIAPRTPWPKSAHSNHDSSISCKPIGRVRPLNAIACYAFPSVKSVARCLLSVLLRAFYETILRTLLRSVLLYDALVDKLVDAMS